MIKDYIERARSYRSFDESKPLKKELLVEFVNNARLSPSSINLQTLKYKICTEKEELDAVLPLTKWAAMIKYEEIPPRGHAPTAYIIICIDKNVSDKEIFLRDVGVAAQTIMLSAAEYGYGGCMIGNFNPEKMAEALKLPDGIVPNLVLGLGAPDEKIILEDIRDGKSAYYRDENGHHVPKRKLEEIIL